MGGFAAQAGVYPLAVVAGSADQADQTAAGVPVLAAVAAAEEPSAAVAGSTFRVVLDRLAVLSYWGSSGQPYRAEPSVHRIREVASFRRRWAYRLRCCPWGMR